MSNTDNNNLRKLITKIKNEQVLLPNFQRSFVWNEGDKQRKLLASFLCELPIGSLLLLHGKKNEFATRKIGSNKNECFNEEENTIFLLDGQQRMTTLTNIFSDIIYDNIKDDWRHIISTDLKKRYFIKLGEGDDLFGYNNFHFPWNIQDDYPPYTVNSILELIHTESVLKNNNKEWYHPENKISKLDYVNRQDAINWYVEKKYLPLFLIYDDQDFEAFNDIVSNIARDRFEKKVSNAKNIEDLQQIFSAEALEYFKIDVKTTPIKHAIGMIENASRTWSSQMNKFFSRLRTEIPISTIEVPEKQRVRAIEIYENINMGGVTLNEFDLLTARAAKVNIENLHQLENLEKSDSLPTYIYKLLEKNVSVDALNNQYEDIDKWNPIDYFKVYNDNQKSINSSLIEQYLKLLSLYDKTNGDYSKLSNLKSLSGSDSLKLNPVDIYKYTERCIIGLSRACAFLQVRVGLLTISELNYKLMLIPLAWILSDDSVYSKSLSFNQLEYWYWGTIFSGRYNTDQSDKCIQDIKYLTEWIIYKKENKFEQLFEGQLFNNKNFSDDNTMLLKNAEYGIFPKEVLINTFQKFVLVKMKSLDMNPKSKNPTTIFNGVNKGIELHSHHIIPISNITTLEESTRKVRDKKDEMINCVGNLTYITKQANLELGSKTPDEYLKYMQRKCDKDGDIALSHLIDKKIFDIDLNNSIQVEDFIEERYIAIKSKIITTMKQLIR